MKTTEYRITDRSGKVMLYDAVSSDVAVILAKQDGYVPVKAESRGYLGVWIESYSGILDPVFRNNYPSVIDSNR